MYRLLVSEVRIFVIQSVFDAPPPATLRILKPCGSRISRSSSASPSTYLKNSDLLGRL